jgi:hypothetical protein
LSHPFGRALFPDEPITGDEQLKPPFELLKQKIFFGFRNHGPIFLDRRTCLQSGKLRCWGTKKPTWLNTLRYSTTPAYSLTGSPGSARLPFI